MTVRKTVDLTIEAICQAWHMIHGRERPSWLPRKLPSGRFEKVEVELRPIELA
jgi:hypothetical protein